MNNTLFNRNIKQMDTQKTNQLKDVNIVYGDTDSNMISPFIPHSADFDGDTDSNMVALNSEAINISQLSIHCIKDIEKFMGNTNNLKMKFEGVNDLFDNDECQRVKSRINKDVQSKKDKCLRHSSKFSTKKDIIRCYLCQINKYRDALEASSLSYNKYDSEDVD